MFKRILLPTDGSDLSRHAVKHGIDFAKSIDADVVGFYSPADYGSLLYSEYIPANLMSRDEFEANAQRAADQHLSFITTTAKEAGVPCETFSVASVAPWQAIIDAAKEKECDLIFMASHGRTGLSALMLGSQTAKVLAHSITPVLVYR